MRRYLNKIVKKWAALRKYLVYWVRLYLMHEYSPEFFDVRHVEENAAQLWAWGLIDVLVSSRKGHLKLKFQSRKLFLLHRVSFGALRLRTERSVFYTLLTLCQEIHNPIEKKALKKYLSKKTAYVNRLLDKVLFFSFKSWDREEVEIHLLIYKRQTLIQLRIIERMDRCIKNSRDSEEILAVKEGIVHGISPLLVIQGKSGTYWMRDKERKAVGVFKPFDEETFAPNNPIGSLIQAPLGTRKMRQGILSGEAVHREVAAFTVDAYLGFGIVPKTQYASFSDPVFYYAKEGLLKIPKMKKKKGSFQVFVEGFVSIMVLSEKELLQIPVIEIQLLFLFDIIIGNTDRHLNNILVAEDGIAAIDNGLCFTEIHEPLQLGYVRFFQQEKDPFLPSIVSFIETIDFQKLKFKLMKKNQLSLNSMDRMFERIALLKACINQNKTFTEIGEIFSYKNLYLLEGLGDTLTKKAEKIVSKKSHL